jgi:hypothetical protein
MVVGHLCEKKERYSCRYCRSEFQSKEECRFHEENVCSLNPNLLKDKNPLVFVKFMIVSTLTVVAIALAILSPIIFYLALLYFCPPPYDYIALGVFWAVIFGVPMILAIVIDYLRKSRKKD